MLPIRLQVVSAPGIVDGITRTASLLVDVERIPVDKFQNFILGNYAGIAAAVQANPADGHPVLSPLARRKRPTSLLTPFRMARFTEKPKSRRPILKRSSAIF